MNILVISLMLGAVITIGVYAAIRIFAAIPKDDRSYMDKPPSGFHLFWPVIKFVAFYFSRFISDNYKYTTDVRLRRAGVNYSLTAEQYFAGKIVAAVVAFLFCWLVQAMLGKLSAVYLVLAPVAGFYYPEIWLKETMDKRNNSIFRALPFFLDVITLAVESGTNLTTGINQAIQKAPDGPLKTELAWVLRDVRAGKPRAEALRAMADRIGLSSLNNVVSGMIQAEKTGASLGPVLRAQSDQLRSTRFLKAEKLAMEAPVKLLGPLVMFIFPTTFLVIVFVMLSQALSDGIITWQPLVWAFNNP